MWRELVEVRLQLHDSDAVAMKWTARPLRAIAALAFILFGACGSSQEPRATWAVDCVAVLGAPPAVATMNPSAMPFSGVRREETVAALSDAELGSFCDFLQCLSGNGYNYVCEQSRLEAPSLVEEAVTSCRRTPSGYFNNRGGDLKPDSRESCVDLLRRYSGRCRVGLVEDCNRERSVWPIAYFSAPSCRALELECPL